MLMWVLFGLAIVSLFARFYAVRNNDKRVFLAATWLNFGSCAGLTILFLVRGIVFHSVFELLFAALWGWNAWFGYKTLFR